MFGIGILEDKGSKGLFAYPKSGSCRSQGWFMTGRVVGMVHDISVLDRKSENNMDCFHAYNR